MQYNFDEIIDRRNSSSMKWNASDMMKQMGVSARFDEDTIAVFTADMDFRCARPILDSMEKLVQHGIFGYSSYRARDEYIPAVQRWFRDRHDWGIDADSILYVNGTVEALSVAIRAYTEEGDGVMITRPVYGPFTRSIEENKRRVVNSQLSNENGYYTMDYEDIEEKAKDSNVKMFILCSPSNPVGRVWTEEELKKLADICERNGMILVSDEVHCDILRKGVKFITAAKVGNPANTVVLNAINKTFNCAGLAASHAIIADKELREKYTKTLGMRMPSPFAIEAVIAAYTKCDEWVDQLLDYLDGTIDWAIDFIHENLPGVKVFRPEGTYVLWMDFSDTGLTPEEVHERIYMKANVCLESGDMFDPDQGKGFERICMPSPRPMMKEAFERIAAQFQDLKK